MAEEKERDDFLEASASSECSHHTSLSDNDEEAIRPPSTKRRKLSSSNGCGGSSLQSTEETTLITKQCSAGRVCKAWYQAFLQPLAWEVVDTTNGQENRISYNTSAYNMPYMNGDGGIGIHRQPLSLMKLSRLFSITKRLVLHGNSFYYTDSDIMSVAYAAQNLKHLQIIGMSHESSFNPKAFSCFKGLTDINISQCHRTSLFLGDLIRNNSVTLERLAVEKTMKDPSIDLGELSKCSRLRKLRISPACASDMDSPLKQILESCAHLEVLDIHHGSTVTDAAFLKENSPQVQALASTKRSHKRDRHKMHVSGQGKSTLGATIEAQSSSTRQLALQSLMLDKTPHLTDKGLLSLLIQCQHLEKLSLRYVPRVTERMLSQLPRLCPLLNSLTLDFCQGVTDNVVKRLIRYPLFSEKLKTLSIAGSFITDKAVEKISRHCRSLRWLNLSWNHRITDKSVVFLSEHLQNLKVLEICSCKKLSSRILHFLRNFSGHESEEMKELNLSEHFLGHCSIYM